ncbi:MAG: peptide deformylase [Christensenellales bacterium]
MAIRNVYKIGKDDEILRKHSKVVKEFDERLWQLLDDMKETMDKNRGMGIAAVQVGVLKRVVIIDCNNMFVELINPEIIASSGSDIDTEGCLSVTKIRGFVERPMNVTVKAQDRYGYDFTLSGEKYLARVLCHEIDHLDGVVFTDKMIRECGEDE